MDTDHCLIHNDPPILIRELVAQIKTYLSAQEVDRVVQAFELSEYAHRDQHRRSGEPYIIHPIAVATILAQMHLDCETVMAALLHDVIEDTEYKKSHLNQEFGEAIANMVDGVSKLHNLNDKSKKDAKSKKEADAASFHKMMLAVTRDIRVIIIKLADRLHNLRTQWFMNESTRRRKALETLELYAPIADRLGLGRMRDELIDLGFSGYYPLRSRVIRHHVRQYHESHRKAIQNLEIQLNQKLEENKIMAAVKFLPAQHYNIYKLLKTKTFRESKDIVNFRIVVKNADQCYRALGVLHQYYQPKTAHSITDHIAIPNANQSQALHTTVIGSKEFKTIQLHICTWEMWAFAEFGITVSDSHKNTHRWVRNVLSLLNNTTNSLDFLEHIKADLRPNEICIFTPKNEIFTLPKGSTVVDFAYALHSDMGDHLVNAKIDDNEVNSLNTVLESGQRIEIVTDSQATPCPEWLNFAVTGKARSHILKFLKKLNREQAIVLGKRLLDHELVKFGKTFDFLQESSLNALLSTFKCQSRDDLLMDIGLGEHLAYLVARQLELKPLPPSEEQNKPLVIRGTEGMVLHFAKCCQPIPQDSIMGFISAGKGILIHTQKCPQLAKQRQLHPENCLRLNWEENIQQTFEVEIRVELMNIPGALASVSQELADRNINIEMLNLVRKDGKSPELRLSIAVHNRKELAMAMRAIYRTSVVHKVYRHRNAS
jgi:GTP diphosphokinase / guanosine-3',5'-bis(diphosphate) 3'-diphosphatase